MGSQQGDASEVDSAELCLRLRSTAAGSVTAAVRYLAGDGPVETAIEAAAHWIEAAETWEEAFSLLALQISGPGEMPWLGQAAQVAHDDGGGLDVAELTELLRTTAAVARIGAQRIREARLAVLAAVDGGSALEFWG